MRATSHSLSLILYLILRYKNQRLDSELLKEGENEKKDKKIYLRFLIPTLLAYISMICFYIALNFIQGSIYQILRGGTVLTTALFSYTYLKIKPTRQKIAGCIFVLIGLIIVGIVNILMSNDSKDQKAETLIGYALITIGLFANAFSFIYEELLVTKFTV